MAIYRAGTASMNASGVITGVGTKWQDKLSLIRVGATMVFLTQPLTICTISAIVSDTELRATQSDGKVVPAGTNYVILLHDSITVDGLAQDVAETLRYYQSRETVIEDAIEFFENFDFEKYKETADQVKANAAAAAASQVAAKTSETNAKTSETNAKTSETNAAASKTAAAASQTAAKTSETNAKTSETNANSSKVAAAASQTAAKTSETNAKTSETNAKTSETNANASKNAAATSASAAAGSATSADASKTAAATSAGQAAGSATSASGSASAAAGSATTAKNEADRAKTEADRAATANPDNQLKKANNLSDVPDKATARNNLQLGIGNTVEFAGLGTRSYVQVYTASDGAEPAGSLVSKRATANGTNIVSSEHRANKNGSVEWIKRDAAGSPRSVVITEDNYVTLAGLSLAPSNLEIGQKDGAGTSYIDLHYDGTKGYDYSARIYCDGMNSDSNGGGNLRFRAGFIDIASKASTGIYGGGLVVETTNVNINTKTATSWDADSLVIRPRTSGSSHYIMFNDLSKNTGWVGNPSNNDDSIGLWSYVHNKGIQISDRIRLNGGDTACQGNLFVDGSSVYVRGASGTNNTHLWFQNTSGRNRAVIYSSDTQVLQLRSDNAATGTSGQALSINGATGECRAATFTNTSDERAKFWIKPVASALDKICQLNGVTYSMHTTIQDTVRKAGVIAQDVKKILPEAVTETDYKGVLDKECREIENPLGVDYSALSALYVEAFKELKKKDEEKDSRIAKLESDIEELKLLVAALAAK